MQDVVEHFSARTLFSSSPPTLFGPLAAPSCQSLSGQLTRSCRAFPATRASGKRPSVALFDVPSTLILFTWTAFCAHFLSTEAPLTFLFFAFSAQHSSFHFSIFPVTLTSSIPDTDEAPLWIYIIYIRVYFLFSFLDFFTFCFSTLDMLPACSCLDVSMVARFFGVVLHKCHIFPALPVWSCGLSGTWPAGPTSCSSLEKGTKVLIDQKDRNKMLQNEVGNDCEALIFHLKHKCVFIINLMLFWIMYLCFTDLCIQFYC